VGGVSASSHGGQWAVGQCTGRLGRAWGWPSVVDGADGDHGERRDGDILLFPILRDGQKDRPIFMGR